MTEFYPMQLTPTLHIKVWGGRKLQDVLGKTLFGDSPYGESWELHDTCTIGNGEFAGRELSDLLAEHGSTILGREYNPDEGLPLLVKFLGTGLWRDPSLVREPACFLLDEPLSALDARLRQLALFQVGQLGLVLLVMAGFGLGTAPAMIAPSPMRLPCSTIARVPSHTSLPMTMRPSRGPAQRWHRSPSRTRSPIAIRSAFEKMAVD